MANLPKVYCQFLLTYLVHLSTPYCILCLTSEWHTNIMKAKFKDTCRWGSTSKPMTVWAWRMIEFLPRAVQGSRRQQTVLQPGPHIWRRKLVQCDSSGQHLCSAVEKIQSGHYLIWYIDFCPNRYGLSAGPWPPPRCIAERNQQIFFPHQAGSLIYTLHNNQGCLWLILVQPLWQSGWRGRKIVAVLHK